MGLLDNLIQEAKKYVRDALPGGLLNPEVGAYLDKAGNNIIAGHKQRDAVQRGLLADPMNSELQKQAFRDGMDLAGMAPLGITAWHGSPHKFDKFSLDKIGTGEGAQAYGHGLYLAESPEVAKSYSKLNPTVNAPPNRIFQGNELAPGTPEYHAGTLLEHSTLAKARKDVAQWISEGSPDAAMVEGWKKTLDTLNKATKKTDFKVAKNENLYKTDIPDEAAARFLDWDKPLSQQAPEVQKAMSQVIAKKNPRLAQYLQESAGLDEAGQTAVRKRLGVNIFDTLDTGGAAYQAAGQGEIEDALKGMGVPGIRYLDGGSRSAGQGSSNFVVFDPEMIRILERNGQATGLKPWAPGEYQGLLR